MQKGLFKRKINKICLSYLVMALTCLAGYVGLSQQANQSAAGGAALVEKPKQKSWTDNVKIKGDIRVREETIKDDSKKDASGDTYTRDRLRLRARLGAEAKFEDLKIGTRISTGDADPLSGNVTLGDGDQRKEFMLDLAFLEYAFLKDEAYKFKGIAGKMNNPFITYNDDLVWDGDLTPEGLAVKGNVGNEWIRLLGNGAWLFIEDRDSLDNATAWLGQSAVQLTFVPEVSLTLGGAYFAFQKFKGYDVIDWQNKNNSYGNSTVKGTVVGSTTNKAWACDFTPIVGFGNLDVFTGKVPISLYGQILTNPEADDNKNGYMGGLSLGKAKNPKTFELGYSYTKLEKDAVLGMWTDSDRWGGGTDGKGSKFYGKYQLNKYLQLAVTFFMDKKNISDSSKETDYNRLQIDLAASF